MSEPLNVLLVEDSEDDALLVLRALGRSGFNVVWERVETAGALRTGLTERAWDVLISDYRLPGFDAPAALAIAQQSQPNLPFIVVSGTIGEAAAVGMMKAGAHDYLMKDSLTRLPEAVRREVREAQIRSERQQTTFELAQTKQRLQLAIEGSGIGLWDWSVQTGAVTFNDRWAEIIGYTMPALEPISIETWRQHTHPVDLQHADLLLEQHFCHEIPVYECELRMRHQAGHWVWVLARGKVVDWDDTGKPLRMIGTHLDMTDRKLAEANLQQLNQDLERRVVLRTVALQQSEARLREAQQVAHLGSWEYDIQTQQITWSAEIFHLFGLHPDTAEPTYEQLLQHYFPSHERERFRNLIERAIHDSEPYATDLQIRRADGSLGYIFAKAEINHNSEGHVIRLFGIAMDISDRKAIQEALQRSEERARATLLALPDLVFRVNRDGQYVDFLVSPPRKNLVDPQQVIGRQLHEVLPPDIAANHYANLQQALATQTLQSYEQQVWLDGKLQYEEVRVAVCGNDEAVFFIRDISDRKQAEAQLRQTNQELARATRLKDEFLANMSHELRTPLTAILGMSETLKERIFGELNAKQQQYIEVIFNSGRHLLQLINDILDVSKISAGKLELDITTVSIHELCTASLMFVKQSALDKQIQLTTVLPADLGSTDMDERRIRQVLLNLLNNAVKFTPSGGQITLEVKLQNSERSSVAAHLHHDAQRASAAQPVTQAVHAQQRTLAPDSWLLFSIIDTGIGIAPEDQAKLFKPFVQLDSSFNRKYEGTGLGLTLVKQIVELHGGSVELTSQSGQGSCFTVRLPYRHRFQALAPPAAAPFSGTQSSTSTAAALGAARSTAERPLILLAEDNQGNIDTFSNYLEVHGYQMLIARNGREAINLTRTHCPDLILMDIQMPDVDGLEAIQIIRQDPQLAKIPIIALTALAMAGDRDRCLTVGANDYLSKPVKLKQLVTTMRQLLASQSI